MDSHLRALAFNNAWANHRLLQACAALPETVLSRPGAGFFGSIIASLNHIYIVDHYYVSALEGACVGAGAFTPEVPYPDLADLRPAQRAMDQRLIAIFDGASPPAADMQVALPRASGTQIERFDRVFLHLVQHQIHHRGQVHGLLSDAGVAPPQLDEFFLDWDADRDLRAPDFAELGFTEDAVWSSG